MQRDHATVLPLPRLAVGHVSLDPSHLELAAGPVELSVSSDVYERVATCNEFVLSCLRSGRPVYGATTGFGPLVIFDGRNEASDQCDNVLSHLSAGQGPDIPTAVVRAAMMVRLWSLCQGHSGVSQAVVSSLTAALRTTLTPAVPRLGSLGASGDLVPLSYVAQALRGRGHAYVDGERMPAEIALRRAGLSPLVLSGRDALALVNGTSLTAAAAGLAVASLNRSLRGSVMLSALLTDLLGSVPSFLAPPLLDAFGHSGAVKVAGALRSRLKGTVPVDSRALQEPYSIRCTPQLVGAAASAVRYAEGVVRDDLNGVSDNPLFFPEQDLVAHGGNFFGQPVAFASDLLSLTAVQLGNLAERQLDLLIDPHRNGGLPPMLAVTPGRDHAVQGVQLAATAIVADMRRSATPASIQSLPTNWHNQDVIPFGTQAALAALDQAHSLRLLHGSLAVALRQAAHVGVRLPTAPACIDLLDSLMAEIPPIEPDRPLDAEVRRAADVLDAAAAKAEIL
ncbi:aromatic amino acid ammonia-lyase [Streptomyces sp. NPDC050121]|uniref:aromatic amino acid ammonia-lyase n=1 Tax=Streptomyces sp. NPDC050121 TaxID=3365601 RepID=UPI00379D25B4